MVMNNKLMIRNIMDDMLRIRINGITTWNNEKRQGMEEKKKNVERCATN